MIFLGEWLCFLRSCLVLKINALADAVFDVFQAAKWICLALMFGFCVQFDVV